MEDKRGQMSPPYREVEIELGCCEMVGRFSVDGWHDESLNGLRSGMPLSDLKIKMIFSKRFHSAIVAVRRLLFSWIFTIIR